MTGASDPRHRPLQIWCADLTVSTDALLALERETPRLPPEDHARAARFADARHGREWTAAHIALRLVLEREAGSSARRVCFARTASGRPSLPDAAVDFSLSHAAGHALIATASPGPVGIDLEAPRRIRISGERRTAIEAAAEALSGKPLPGDGEARFLQAWVRLEALVKAEDTTMARVLSKAGAYGPRRGGPRASVNDFGLGGRLGVYDVALGSGLYAAIVLPEPASPVQVVSLPTNIEDLRQFPQSLPA